MVIYLSRILVSGILIALVFSSGLSFKAQSAPYGREKSTQIFVDTQVDSNDSAYQACTDAPNDCSLRGAISKANADPSTTWLINLPEGTYTLTLADIEDNNLGGDLDIKANLTLKGAKQESTTIDGGQHDRVVEIFSGVTVSMNGLTITGGVALNGRNGGGILNNGTLTLTNCTINSNSAGNGTDGEVWVSNATPGGDGGGIFNGGNLILQNSTISGNSAGIGGSEFCYDADGCLMFGIGADGGSGGGIENNGTLTINNSLLSNNASGKGGYGSPGLQSDGIDGADGFGGGVNNSGTLTINQGTIRNNSGGSGGGGVNNKGDLNIFEETILDNSSEGGGGIRNIGNLTLMNSSISDNSTWNGKDGSYNGYEEICFNGADGGFGGGLLNSGSAMLIGDIVSFNHTGNGGTGGYIPEFNYCNGGSGGPGGAIHNSGTLLLSDMTVKNNTTGNGGAPGEDEYGTGLQGTGGYGGGVYATGGSSLSLIRTGILGNSTGSGRSSAGGGIFMDSITIGRWENTIIAGNTITPEGSGSGIYISDSSPTLLYTTIAQNTGGDGSGIYSANSTLSLMNTIIAKQTIGITAEASSTINLEATLWGNGDWANQYDTAGAGSFNSGAHIYWGDPSFVDPSTLNYHIQATSEAIDKGIEVAGVTTDIDDQPRPNPDTAIPDIGADEYWNSVPIYTQYLPLVIR